MKKLLVKAELIDIPYSPEIQAVEAVEYQPEKWTKEIDGSLVEVFEQPLLEDGQPDLSYTYQEAVQAVEAVEYKPEQLEVKSIHVLGQTQGEDDDLAVWLSGNLHKYPENHFVEYIDISAEVEQQELLSQAMQEITKGIQGIAVFKVRVKQKQLTTAQIAQLFSSEQIKQIIETLSTGSLPLAASLIQAYPADGVIVTEEDKQAVLQAIS
jgi:hypothetical protein